MNEKEIAKIKRQFKQNNKNLLIHNIAVYYVGIDKRVSAGITKKFCEQQDMMEGGKSGSEKYWDLAEENAFLEIIKRTLSGKLEKELMEYDFQSEQKGSMLTLLNTKLDEHMGDTYAEYIAEKLDYIGDYAILMANCEFVEASKDGKGWSTTDDDLINTDALVYDFMVVSIVETDTVSIGLFYDRENGSVHKWDGKEKEINSPLAGFLYPVLNDDAEDMGKILVFNKDIKDPLTSLVDDVLGLNAKVAPVREAEIVANVASKMIKKTEVEISPEAVKEQIEEVIAKEPEKEIGKEEIREILVNSGVPEPDLVSLDEVFEAETGNPETKVHAENLTTCVIKPQRAPKIIINVKDAQKARKEIINGKECLVIEIDDEVEIKGL